MNFIGVIFSCISVLFWGLLTGLILALLGAYVVHKVLNLHLLLTALGGVVMFFFFSFQFTACLGAFKAKNYIDKVVMMVGTTSSVSGSVLQEFPFLQSLANEALMYVEEDRRELEEHLNQGMRVAEQMQSLYVCTLKKLIDNYIWRRIFWMLGGGLLSFGIVSLFSRPRRKMVSLNSYSASSTTRNGTSTSAGSSTLKF